MKVRFGASLLVGLGAATVLWSMSGGPDGVHAYMEDQNRCAGCHHVEKDGDDWILDPHIFSVSVVDACRICHPPQKMGRSHPVGMDPRRGRAGTKIPAQLPLQAREGERGELMTCGTCHNPHLPRLSRQKAFPTQPPFPGRSGEYLTYFLRPVGQNSKEGFTALCHACHPDL